MKVVKLAVVMLLVAVVGVGCSRQSAEVDSEEMEEFAEGEGIEQELSTFKLSMCRTTSYRSGSFVSIPYRYIPHFRLSSSSFFRI